MLGVDCLLFFFSSRRRHTRFDCDWSSDVCSSDLKSVTIPIQRALLFRPRYMKGNPEGLSTLRNTYRAWYFKRNIEQLEAQGLERELKIGRASCRERV